MIFIYSQYRMQFIAIAHIISNLLTLSAIHSQNKDKIIKNMLSRYSYPSNIRASTVFYIL